MKLKLLLLLLLLMLFPEISHAEFEVECGIRISLSASGVSGIKYYIDSMDVAWRMQTGRRYTLEYGSVYVKRDEKTFDFVINPMYTYRDRYLGNYNGIPTRR